MNKIAGRCWSRFKQEFPSIIFLSTLTVWDILYFPSRINLDDPFNNVFLFIKISFGVILVIYLFTSIDKFAQYIKFEHIKDSPYVSAAKNKQISIITLIVGASTVMFFAWYTNFLAMPNSYYIFICSYFFIMWFLLHRAACRVDSEH